MTTLHNLLTRQATHVICLTPPVFDELLGGHPGYRYTLERYSQWLRDQRPDWDVVDINAAMSVYLDRQRETLPGFACCRGMAGSPMTQVTGSSRVSCCATSARRTSEMRSPALDLVPHSINNASRFLSRVSHMDDELRRLWLEHFEDRQRRTWQDVNRQTSDLLKEMYPNYREEVHISDDQNH